MKLPAPTLAARRSGIMVQNAHLFPSLTAQENVEIPLRLAVTPSAERDQRARAALEQVGLGPRAQHRGLELSGGVAQQRVALARALVHRPRFLVARWQHSAGAAGGGVGPGAGVAAVKTHTLSPRRRWLAVLGGGFLGAITRALRSATIQSAVGKAWPYDIFAINLTGAFVLVLVTVLADTTTLVGPTRRLFINVGFLGAYTTFSSMALGDMLLLGKAHWLSASLYIVLSMAGGVVMALLGETAGRWLAQALRSSSALLPSRHQDADDRASSSDAPELLLADALEEQEIKHSH